MISKNQTTDYNLFQELNTIFENSKTKIKFRLHCILPIDIVDRAGLNLEQLLKTYNDPGKSLSPNSCQNQTFFIFSHQSFSLGYESEIFQPCTFCIKETHSMNISLYLKVSTYQLIWHSYLSITWTMRQCFLQIITKCILVKLQLLSKETLFFSRNPLLIKLGIFQVLDTDLIQVSDNF